MGLCGETKIAKKAESFVSMMQGELAVYRLFLPPGHQLIILPVFEYYISHHMTKSFEYMFVGVTCLPGCFRRHRLLGPDPCQHRGALF